MNSRDLVQRILVTAAIVAACAFYAADAAATCSSSVSASVSGMTLSVTASAGGQCGNASMSIAIDGGAAGSFNCQTASCSHTWTFSTACYRTGSHTVTASSSCGRNQTNSNGSVSCVGDSPGSSSSSFSVNTTPTVSVSHSKLDDLGNGQMTVPYSFPNTAGYWQRWIGIYVDGNLTWTTRPSDANGSWVFEADTTCWSDGAHAIKAVAVACDAWSDPAYKAENETSISVTMKPTVSVTHAKLDDLGNGRMSVPYHFPNTQGYWQRWIGVYVDGNLTWSTRPSDNNGTWVFDADTTCWSDGTHTIMARAVACDAWSNPGYQDEKQTSINVTMKPTVSVSHAKLDDLGNGTMSVPYHFPNTQGYWQRWIGVYVDGNLTWSTRPSDNNGTWVFEADTTCWSDGTHTIMARAVACDAWSNPGYQDEKQTSINVTMTPTVSVSHEKLDDLGNGRMIVPYHFPNTQGYWQRWIGIYVDGNLTWSTRPSNNEGTWVFEADTTCWSDGSHTILARAVSCDAWSNPSYQDEGETSISVTMKPSVSVSHAKLDNLGNGTMTVTYHFPNTQGYWQRWIGVYVDGNLTWSTRPSNNEGTWVFEADTTCWKDGAHTIRALAVACDAWSNPSYQDEDETSINVTGKPEVGLQLIGPDSAGNVTVTVPYNFPNTQGYWQRWLAIYIDGNQYATTRPSAVSGTWTVTLNAACVRPKFKAVAVSCDQWNDPAFRDEEERELSQQQTQPTVSVSHTGPDLSGVYLVTVTWSFPGAGSRHIDVYQSGSQILSFDPPSATGSRVLTVTGCGEIDAIATACGKTGDPAFTGKGKTILPPDGCKEDRSFCSYSGPSGAAPGGALGDRDGLTAAGRPVNAGSGDVSVTVPLFSIDSASSSLDFVLEYHSAQPLYRSLAAEFAPGWSHTFSGTMRPLDATATLLYRTSASGREYVYQRSGTTDTWVAIRPREVAETVTRSAGRYQVTALDGSSVTYDEATGRLLSTRDRWGNAATASYDGTGNLTSIADADGRTVTIQAVGTTPSTITLPGGATWRFAYASGNLSAIYDPMHTGATPWRTFTYSNDRLSVPRLMTAMRDDSSALLEGHTYDAQERGTSSFVGANRELVTFQYGVPSAGKTRVTHELETGLKQVYELTLLYQPGKYLPVVSTGSCSTCGGGSGGTETREYDTSNRVTRWTDGEGNVTQYTYDAVGNVLSATSAAGTPLERRTTYEYTYPAWPSFATKMTEPSTTGSGFKVLERQWNAGETVLTVTESGKINASTPTSRTTTITYDARHRAIADDGPRTDVADVTTRTYYAANDANVSRRGRLATAVNPAGHVTTFENYDVYGNALRVVDANGAVRELETDARGRAVRTIQTGGPHDPTVHDTVRQIDSRDRLTSMTDAGGNVVRFAYEDGTNWTTATIRLNETGAEAERVLLTLNGIGKTTREDVQKCDTPANPCASWTTMRSKSFVYDSDAHLVRTVEDGAQVVYTYDENGRVTTIQDENHTSPNVAYAYDALSRLSVVTQTLGSGSAVTRYGYDSQNNLTSVVDPNGNTTTYEYDDFSDVRRQVSPVSGTTTHTYDSAGNLLSTTDATGATTILTYDVLGRATSTRSSRSGAADELVEWSFDGVAGLGRLASVSDPTGSTVYGYDGHGRLSSQVKTIEGTAYTTAFEHDANGNPTEITYPSGTVARTTYDFAGRPKTLHYGATPIVTGATYLPFGPPSQITFGNGTTRDMAHDARYRMTGNALRSPSATLASYALGHDPAGNITSISDSTDPSYNRTFTYDDLDRLVTTTTGPALWGSGAYVYDPMGNLLSSTTGAKSSLFSYSGTTPKLLSVQENGSSRNVTYDAAGNETAVGPDSFVYSARNRLATAGQVEYRYDAYGLRAVTTYPSTIASLALAPATLYTNQSGLGTVTLDAPAETGGVIVTIASSSASVVVPASVTIAEGEIEGTFPVTLAEPAVAGTVTITATRGISRTATLEVLAGPPLATVTVNPASVAGDATTTVTVTLSAAAPAGGAPVRLASDSPLVVVPAGLTVPAGETTATTTATTSSVAVTTTATITATYDNSATATLQLQPLAVISVTAPPSVVGGRAATGSVVLNGPAPAGGAAVSLSSSNAAASVPPSVTVVAGQSTGAFAITTSPQTATVNATLTAQYNGSSASTTLAVTPCTPVHSQQPPIPAGDTVFVDDSLPPGATLQGGYGMIFWDPSQSASGSRSLVNGAGETGHFESYIWGLNEPLHIGENLVAYLRVNECEVPREIRISWQAGDVGHIYWGEPLLPNNGLYMGPVPAAGEWVRVEVPLRQLNLEVRTLTRIWMAVYGGQVWFDHFGKSGIPCYEAREAPPSVPAGDTVFVDDASSLPPGAFLQGGAGIVHWDSEQSATGSESLVNSYSTPAARSESYIWGLNEPFHVGEKAVAYFRVNECAVPREIRISWQAGNVEHVYWGEPLMENNGLYMGPVPTTGDWVRVEVPLRQLDQEKRILTRIWLAHFGGQVWFDHLGKTGTPCFEATEPQPSIPPGDTVFVDDTLPPGATLQGGRGTSYWDPSQSASGSQSLGTTYHGPDARHESYIWGLNEPLHIGENVVAYFRVDECAVPREIRLTWQAGDVSHVYWGEPLMENNGLYMGPVPTTGDWVRVVIPLSQLDLEQNILTRIWMAHYGGDVWFDRFGKNGTPCFEEREPQPSIPSGDTVFVDDTLPPDATLQGGYGKVYWDPSQSASGSQSLVDGYSSVAARSESYIWGLNVPLNEGESVVAYLRVNECAIPREIKLSWQTGGSVSHAHWGEPLIGNDGLDMGPVPATGDWVRVEIPISQLGITPGAVLTRIWMAHYGGQVWFDSLGKTGIAGAQITGFTASHPSPQPQGTTITWTATATGTVMPLQYRFEHELGGVWTVVQPYSPSNTYTWTPTGADVGVNTIRVSVRNGGSVASFDDFATSTMTITSTSGTLRRAPKSFLARLRDRFTPRPPVSLGVESRPIQSTSTNSRRRYSLYSPESRLIAQTTVTTAAAPPVEHELLWFGGIPVAQADRITNTIQWTFADHLGTPILQTDATAAVTWRVEREPYGAVFATRTGADRHQPLALPGQEVDSATPELTYNVFRWYRSEWGRYSQADPLGLEGGINEFSYADGQPTGLTDRLGLATKKKPTKPAPKPPAPPDCKSMCAKAYADPKLNKNGGGVVCMNGQKCPCVFDTYAKLGECPEMDEVFLNHEKRHVPEAECPSKSLCRGIPRAAFDLTKVECTHRKETVKELGETITKGFSTPKCIQAMLAMSMNLNGWIKKECH